MKFSQSDIDQARAEGARQEHERIAAVLRHPKAATHPAFARQMIMSGVPADKVDSLFGAMPHSAAPTTGTPILEALDKLFGTVKH